jgi:hypothetical protein
MPSTTGVSVPIYGSRSGVGAQPEQRRLAEAATQTFLQGTPVEVVGGYLQAWDETAFYGAIAGISSEPGRNRSSAGVPQLTTAPGVQNEPNAVVIQIPPFDDGKLNIYTADTDTYFFGEANTTAAQANVGNAYGLTKDTNGYWYVDFTKTTTSGAEGSNQAVVRVTGLDDWDPRGVYFQFLTAAILQQQLQD